MKGTIHINELLAIMIMTEVAFITKKTLGDRVGDIIFVTDSTIALCWIHNENKRLRIYVLNTVETIRGMINWTIGEDEIPLFQVDGTQNIADLLTKQHIIGIEDVSDGSAWQDGNLWMRLERDEMPLKAYSDLTVPQNVEDQVQAECYDHLLDPREDGSYHDHEIFSIFANEVFINSVATGRVGFGPIIDPISNGWFRTIRIIQNVLRFTGTLLHWRNHVGPSNQCYVCNQLKILEKDAENVLMRYETQVIKVTLKPDKLNQFKEFDGVLYYQSRITEENLFTTHDLDQVPFLDAHEFTGKAFVIMLDSPVLYSYIMVLHNKVLPDAF